MENLKEILRAALVKTYGFTPDRRLAGYITPQGELLNFSSDGRSRDIDHREVNEVIETDPVLDAAMYDANIKVEPGSNAYGVIWLMSQGYIRVGKNFADIAVSPTARQRRVLWLIAEASLARDSFTLEISDRNGKRLWSRCYAPGMPAIVVIRDIDDHFGGAVE